MFYCIFYRWIVKIKTTQRIEYLSSNVLHKCIQVKLLNLIKKSLQILKNFLLMKKWLENLMNRFFGRSEALSTNFFGTLVSVGWQALNSFIAPWSWVLWANNSSISTLPFAGIHHMQQCQVGVSNSFLSLLWSKWMVHEKWSLWWRQDSNPQPFECKSSA